jgi:hypothetical protein
MSATTWVVRIVDHQHDDGYYGPYDEEQADQLVNELVATFEHNGVEEWADAEVMSLNDPHDVEWIADHIETDDIEAALEPDAVAAHQHATFLVDYYVAHGCCPGCGA